MKSTYIKLWEAIYKSPQDLYENLWFQKIDPQIYALVKTKVCSQIGRDLQNKVETETSAKVMYKIRQSSNEQTTKIY